MLFLGIDLAWSDRNNSGFAVIEGNAKGGRLISSSIVKSDSEIIDNINKAVKRNGALIAIDAPLIVPNAKGRRVAEELVGDLFRRYNAGAHPSNRERLGSWSGKIRGEELSMLLQNEGFEHSPYLRRFEKNRKFFEVYPHPSMVVLFRLNRILNYKAKPNRDYEERYHAFKEYQSHLRALERANPPISMPNNVLKEKVDALKGNRLKEYEDMLDAIFCACIAYYCWANPDKCAVLGDMQKGYILTPITDGMKIQLKIMTSQAKLRSF